MNIEFGTSNQDAQLSYTKVMNTLKSKKKRQQHIGFAAIFVKLKVQAW